MVFIAVLLWTVIYNIQPMMIFDFSTETSTSQWTIVNDVVMGGRSDASISINSDGHGVFCGRVSLENNGGFCSLRYGMNQLNVERYSKVIIKLKGDGKTYQFRVKSNNRERHSYIANFDTNGEWQSIEIELIKMAPTFRGRPLSMPNYPKEVLSEIRFLIGNKKEETFTLLIDSIELQ